MVQLQIREGLTVVGVTFNNFPNGTTMYVFHAFVSNHTCIMIKMYHNSIPGSRPCHALLKYQNTIWHDFNCGILIRLC